MTNDPLTCTVCAMTGTSKANMRRRCWRRPTVKSGVEIGGYCNIVGDKKERAVHSSTKRIIELLSDGLPRTSVEISTALEYQSLSTCNNALNAMFQRRLIKLAGKRGRAQLYTSRDTVPLVDIPHVDAAALRSCQPYEGVDPHSREYIIASMSIELEKHHAFTGNPVKALVWATRLYEAAQA